MTAETSAIIITALDYIQSQQRADGGFDGLATANNFQTSRQHPTIFFTALISQACSQIAGGDAITAPATKYLLTHKSQEWSWNYWQRDAAGRAMRGYPDDLDDTACALAAVHGFDSTLIDGSVLGNIGKQLVSTEVQPGGPYQTWLVPDRLRATWYDIDIAVNANIAFLLAQLDVKVAGLERYLNQALAQSRLVSSYYIGTIPILYFIARASHSKQRNRLLRNQLNRVCKMEPQQRTGLENALLLAAGCWAEYGMVELKQIRDSLLTQRVNDHWSAAELYVEPPIDGIPYVAGSAALSTAFACEALSLYDRMVAKKTSLSPPKRRSVASAMLSAQRFARQIAQPELRQQYQRTLRQLNRQDTDGQITELATAFNSDSGRQANRQTVAHLNQASLNGWLAYTIYDDFLDDQAQPVQLSAANLALRQSLWHFEQALPDNRAFQTFVREAFMTIDGANTWEVAHARAKLEQGKPYVVTVPEYDDYNQLADRSWGHVLATTGVLMAAGCTLQSTEVHTWHTFFRHFLIARQLNDDAHDWLDDLAAGRLSSVVCLLLQNERLPRHYSMSEIGPQLRQKFWEDTIDVLTPIITDHITRAETALRDCTFLQNTDRYQALLDRLAGGVAATHYERRQAQSFMQQFLPTDLT